MSTDADRIRDVVAGVAHHIDGKRWEDLRALYADEVVTDYTSLFGGAPQTNPGDALVAGWRTVLASAVTQHLLGPVVVDVAGERARARCHVRALHFAAGAPSGDTWEVLGHYVFELHSQGGAWKIVKMTLETLLQTGNRKLLAEATPPT